MNVRLIQGIVILVYLCAGLSVSALQSGNFTYALINGGTEVAITDYPTGESGAITVPDLIDGKPVTMIGGDAFYYCRDLTEINLPATITVIGSRAFYNCESLTSMELPASVEYLSGYAFNSCSGLTNVILSSSIPKIYEYTFENCSKLKSLTLPPVSTIGPGAFKYCDDLISIVIPDSVTQMGQEVFYRCGSLNSITLSQNLISIPKDAFYACGNLQSVAIPSSVGFIDDGAFRFCWGLNSVVMPNSVTSVGSDAFRGCNSLASLSLPESVDVLGPSAFQGCYNLTNVHLSAAITRLEPSTFSGCGGLPVLNISSNVTYLGGSLFEDCSSLAAVNIAASNPVYGSLDGVIFNAGLTELLYYPPNKADALYAVPGSISTIATGGFAAGPHLKSLLIPASVTTMGNYALKGSSALTDVLFEGDAPSVFGSEIFDDTDAEFSVFYLHTNSGFSTPAWQGYPAQPLDLFTYQLINGNTEVEITGYPSGAAGALVIPSYIGGKPVTSIGDFAFQNATNLTSIVFSERLTAIGESAFSGCVNLSELTLPSTLVSVGNNAFAGCPLLAGAHFEGNAPATFGTDVFFNADPGFEITYAVGAAGFTTPTWNGYAAHPQYIFEAPGTIGTPLDFSKLFLSAGGNFALGLISGGSISGWGSNSYGELNVPAPNTDFQAVAGGFRHALGLKRDGTVAAWGYNNFGQRNVPYPNTNFVSVAAGSYVSFGIKTDSSIVAWGNNNFDQRNVPAPNTNFVLVAAGNDHALGLKSDGSIVTWGDRARVVPAPNTNFVAIAAGGQHALGLKADGSIVAWGSNNSYGQTNVPSPNADFVAVAAGYYHSMGLKSDGSIVTWGSNDSGQLDVPLPNLDFVAISGGTGHSVGVRKDGSVATWGSQTAIPNPNSGFYSSGVEPDAGPLFGGYEVTITGEDLCNGQIWDVTNVTLCGISATVLRVSGSTQIVVQAASSLAETNGAVVVQSISNGTSVRENAFTYGLSNEIYFPPIDTQRTLNVLELYATASSGLPVAFEVLSGPAILNNETNLSFSSTGTVSMVAIQPGDALWDAARAVTNTFMVAGSRPGEIGRGADALRRSIACGQTHSLAIKANGSIVSWGRNDYGKLDVPSPNAGFVAISGGNNHSLGLKEDGSVVGWGYNNFGQLDAPEPNASFISIAAGAEHSLGLKSDGSIHAWGKNDYGQSTVPATNTGFIAVAGGEGHSLGLKSDGTIVGWGYNAWGQAAAPSPNTNFTDVAAGRYFSMGLKGDGSIVTWGNGATLPAANSNFVAIATRDNYAFGLKSDGSIAAWDYSYYSLTPPGLNTGFVAADGGGSHSVGLKSDGSLQAWGTFYDGLSSVPFPNEGYFTTFSGVSPDLGPLSGGMDVTITGTSLCNGTLSDVTNVTLCGVSASVLSVSGSTQIVVRAGSAPSASIGDVVVRTRSNGTTMKPNAFNYGIQEINFPAIETSRTSNLINLQAGSTSGLPVEFAVVSGPATISNGSSLSFYGTGTVSIVAMQPGNAGWNAATSITNTFAVEASLPGRIGSRSVPFQHAIAAGYNHSLALKAEGSILAWGSGYSGETNVPPPNSDFISIAAGSSFSLGLKSDGSVVGWGWDAGDRLTIPAPNAGFVDLAAGPSFSLGLKSDGSIVGWGYNGNAQLNIPAPNADFIAMDVGGTFALGLKAEGSIVGWGNNQYGQTNIPAPNADFINVAAGEDHCLGLKSDGSIVAWGNNGQGQTNVPNPNVDFIAVSAGNSFSLGLKSDGSIVAWGSNNSYGQTNVPSPNADFVAVAAGYYHSMGLKSDGSIVTWGNNLDGQTNAPSPNSGYYSFYEGVTPNIAPTTGGTQVTLTGVGLCNGLIGDVIDVSLCGISASVLSVSGSTQIVVQAGSAPAESTGDVIIQTISYGITVKTNAFTYEKSHQAISFPPIGTNTTDSTVHLTATASSGLPVSFSVVSGPATITNGTTLGFSATGSVAVVAMQAGNAAWFAAPAVTNIFEVNIGAYTLWADAFGLVGSGTGDDDADGINNLLEYAQKGNPTNGVKDITGPTVGSISSDAGTNWLVYIHIERTTPGHGLTYWIERTEDLTLTNAWTNVMDAVWLGDSPSIDEFKAVTNRIPIRQAAREYFRLNISK